jgi:DNA-binding NtrC family response regulator
MNWLRNLVDDSTDGAIRILALMTKNQELSAIADRAGWRIDWAASVPRELTHYEIILCDRAPGWKETIRRIATAAPRSRAILVSPDSDDHLWQDVIDCGGYDVLTRPFQTDRVVRLIQFASAHRRPA